MTWPGRTAERGASVRAYSEKEEMIVAIEKQDSTSLEQVRTALVDWGVKEIRTCHIGLSDVLIAHGASHELADRARSLPGVTRVVFPLRGSPLAERRNFPADTAARWCLR